MPPLRSVRRQESWQWYHKLRERPKNILPLVAKDGEVWPFMCEEFCRFQVGTTPSGQPRLCECKFRFSSGPQLVWHYRSYHRLKVHLQGRTTGEYGTAQAFFSILWHTNRDNEQTSTSTHSITQTDASAPNMIGEHGQDQARDPLIAPDETSTTRAPTASVSQALADSRNPALVDDDGSEYTLANNSKLQDQLADAVNERHESSTLAALALFTRNTTHKKIQRLHLDPSGKVMVEASD